MTQQTVPNIDIIDSDFLQEATTRSGPWVSIYLPTHRTGREVLAGRSQLGNLLKLAEKKLVEQGHEPDSLLSEVRSSTESHEFWQNQSDGLAVFAAPGYTRLFRLPVELPDEVSVGECPRLTPIAPLLSGSGQYYVLALSNHSVRLFEATRTSIGELDLGDTPRSVDALGFDDDPQRSHMQSMPRSPMGIAGHGGEPRLDELATQQLFRAVADGVAKVLGRSKAPIVLASVAEHHSAFKSVSQLNVLDDIVAGNPDNLSAKELYEAARPIAKAMATRRNHDLADQFNSLVGAGKGSDDQQLIARAAQEGRVDTLLLTRQPSRVDGQPDLVEDPVDAIIVDVFRNSGSVVVLDDDGAAPVRAIFRY